MPVDAPKVNPEDSGPDELEGISGNKDRFEAAQVLAGAVASPPMPEPDNLNPPLGPELSEDPENNKK